MDDKPKSNPTDITALAAAKEGADQFRIALSYCRARFENITRDNRNWTPNYKARKTFRQTEEMLSLLEELTDECIKNAKKEWE